MQPHQPQSPPVPYYGPLYAPQARRPRRWLLGVVGVIVVAAIVAVVVFVVVPAHVTISNVNVAWGQCVTDFFFGDSRIATVTFDLRNSGLQDGYATYQLYVDFVADGHLQALVPAQSALSVTLTKGFSDCAGHDLIVKIASVQSV